MDSQTQAQLYLSDQRGCSQLDFFRSFHSFNFGRYVAEHRKPFGALRVLNDTTLKAGHSITMQVESPTDVIVIPVVGGLDYQSPLGNGFLEAGQVQIFSLANGMGYEISNPYESELINYLEIWLTSDAVNVAPAIQQTTFDLTTKNKLLPIFSINGNEKESCRQSKGFIGKYTGRTDEIYPVQNLENGVFVFVLSGVFEVQNRLLHERDGLALRNMQHGDVELEALSNDALLVLLEISLTDQSG